MAKIQVDERKRVRLDIDLITEHLYHALLGELRAQHGDGCYDDWEITARKAE